MSDFTGINGGDYGDLQAVVRGCNNGFFSTTSTFMDDPPATCFASATIHQDDDDDDEFVFSANFPDSFETTTTVLDELEQLYKPFYYPLMLKPLSPQSFLSSSSSSSISVSGSEEREHEKGQEKEPFSGSAVVVSDAAASTALAVKYKRRKTQHKRVVLQVTAEDLSSDPWSWRKYGQKPIKGSPHPRSYYRCSSSKGCLARKQVERSQSDPDMFVVSYTAEHCHNQPTRRSSLAGTTRHKFSVPKSSTSTGGDSGGSLISSLAAPAQQNLSLAAMEDEQTMKKKSTEKEEEEEEDEQRMISERSEHNDNEELMICDMILSDDFLLGFDELDRLMNSDPSYNGALLEQLPMIFPC